MQQQQQQQQQQHAAAAAASIVVRRWVVVEEAVKRLMHGRHDAIAIMTKSRPDAVRRPTYKAPRKALATRAVEPTHSYKAPRKAIATRVHTDEALDSARRAEYGPPTDGKMFDIATAYCRKRLNKFQVVYNLATEEMISKHRVWDQAIKYHNKFTKGFELFHHHVRIKFGFPHFAQYESEGQRMEIGPNAPSSSYTRSTSRKRISSFDASS
jgi:hypothetical protein